MDSESQNGLQNAEDSMECPNDFKIPKDQDIQREDSNLIRNWYMDIIFG